MVTTNPSENKNVVSTTFEDLGPVAIRNLSYVRGHRSIFSPAVGFSSINGALFLKNDTARTFVNDEQIKHAQGLVNPQMGSKIRDHKDEICKHAMEKVLAKHPEFAKQAFAVKTATVDAEWFLRVVSYAIAGGSTTFLNMESLSFYPGIYEDASFVKAGVPFLVDLVNELKSATAKATGSQDGDKYFAAFVDALHSLEK